MASATERAKVLQTVEVATGSMSANDILKFKELSITSGVNEDLSIISQLRLENSAFVPDLENLVNLRYSNLLGCKIQSTSWLGKNQQQLFISVSPGADLTGLSNLKRLTSLEIESFDNTEYGEPIDISPLENLPYLSHVYISRIARAAYIKALNQKAAQKLPINRMLAD